MKRIIIATLIFCLLIGAHVIAATGTSKTDSLNVREKPSTDSKSIGVLDKNEKVDIISKENDWYKIKYNNEEGYVKADYIQSDDDKEETELETNTIRSDENVEKDQSNTTSTDNKKLSAKVQLYVLPLINSTKIEMLDEGTEIHIITSSGKWLYVQADKKRGWVISKSIDTIETSAEESNDDSEEKNETNNDDNTIEENTVKESNTSDSENEKYPVTMYVSGDSVNIRESASTTSEAISGVTKNTSVKVIAKEGDWYKVETKDGVGYIKSDLLSSSKQ